MPTGKTLDQSVEKAHQRQQVIFALIESSNQSVWALAKELYEFQEEGGWALLGYETLNDFLAQPEVGMSRATFFRITRCWRTLVVERKVKPKLLAKLEPTKIEVVLPQIVSGE